MSNTTETFISVDVETAGPNPCTFSLLAIGACLVTDPDSCFYVEIQPVNTKATDEALAISQLNLDKLQESGLPPEDAMIQFSQWVEKVTPEDNRAVFVAFNASFDWMFVNENFHRYLGYNPFGHKALDIKAYYMGMRGIPWSETSWEPIANRYLDDRPLKHKALQDAKDQAEVFCQMLKEHRNNNGE
jgi:DNA polymerase III epsilon subunit-like protein